MRPQSGGELQGLFREGKFGYGFSADQVFLDDALEGFGGAGVVPGAFGVDDGDGAVVADAEAVDLGAIDAAGVGQAQFLQARFQKFPRGQARLLGAALGFGLVATEEDVAPDRAEVADVGGAFKCFKIGHGRASLHVVIDGIVLCAAGGVKRRMRRFPS